MNSPFTINEVKQGYTVTWPSFYNIRGNPTCFNLLKLLFEKIKVDEAMLLLNKDQMVTIQNELWYTKRGEAYSEWLMSQYDVTGVFLKQKDQASKLKEEFEKKYMWQLLKA